MGGRLRAIDHWPSFAQSRPDFEKGSLWQYYRMKDSEVLALRYLSSLGLTSIDYEPDGNVPPDFLANGRIAIEVRRLNQNFVAESGEVGGIEKARFDLLRCVRGVLSSLGPPAMAQSWFVCYEFCRPLPPLLKLRREIREVLLAFRAGQIDDRRIRICDRFSLELIPSSVTLSHYFVLGGYQDLDSGGWLVAELERNLRICIREKGDKIARVRSRYSQWWLLLIDCIGYGAQECINVKHDWDKIILVSPLDPNCGYEI